MTHRRLAKDKVSVLGMWSWVYRFTPKPLACSSADLRAMRTDVLTWLESLVMFRV